MSKISGSDLAAVENAYDLLENPSLLVRLSSAFGMPVEAVAKQLGKSAPAPVVEVVNSSAQKALTLVMERAARTLRADSTPPAPRAHTAAVLTTGAIAGFFGVEALLIELPVTTGIMFRSIADIARAEGEKPDRAETLLECMQVFAMGSRTSTKDDAAETSYYGARLLLGRAVADALSYATAHGIQGASAPALVRFITAVANRFGIVVTQKAMAQTLPVIGAVGGGLVNTLFISHFQDVARGHFLIRRMERRYGAESVRAAYEEIRGARRARVVDE